MSFALIILTHSTPQENKEQSDRVEYVVGGNPEDKLEIERVELRNEEQDGDAQDGHPPLEAAQRVPRELYPAVWRKLTKETLDLSSKCRNLIKSPPVVSLHAQIPGINNKVQSDSDRE